ncbi:MAG: serine hydrolase [Candidatus Paceibacterota bacterium]
MTDEHQTQPQNEPDETPLIPGHETPTPSVEESRMPVVRQLSILGLVLLGLFSASFVPMIVANFTPEKEDLSAAAEAAVAQETIGDPEAFADISIKGEAAFVWDVNSGEILYEKNADAQLPIASITKLMTALVAYEIIAAETSVAIPDSAIAQNGDSGLRAGETFTFSALADLTLVSSSNDGAFAMAAAAGAALDGSAPAQSFVEAMNIRANELGLTNTYFRNPTGLDITESEAGAFSSARDVAKLMEYILRKHPSILEATTEPGSIFYNQNGEYHEAENTNYTVNQIPGIIGSKTGYTALSGGNLAVAFDASVNRPVILVVLGSTYTGRFNDVLTLTQATQQAVQ